MGLPDGEIHKSFRDIGLEVGWKSECGRQGSD